MSLTRIVSLNKRFQFLTTLIFFKGNSLSASNTQSHMSIEIINYMEDTD